MSSFDNKKRLRFVITLGIGTFGSSNNNQITLEGLRATVNIDKAGGVQMNTLHANIYGVKQSDMNAITTIAYQPDQLLVPSDSSNPSGMSNNSISVFAIDGSQVTLVFSGNIINSWGNYQTMPDVFLQIEAKAGFVNQLVPVAPTSYKGTVDAAGSILSQLAKQMGYIFENNLTQPAVLSNPSLAGTALEQAQTVAQHAGLGFYLDDDVLAVTQSPYSPRNTPFIPEISPQSGLVGYPSFNRQGVVFQTLFNPALTFGGSFKLVTSIPRAAGQWFATSIGHQFESEKIGGAWFSTVCGTKSKLVTSQP